MTGQQLKNSILQWAIQGKLVPQIESEGTAEDLLKEIRAEKEKLVKEGKLKKKDLEVKPIEEDEILFEIPSGWRWVRIGDVFLHASGKQLAGGKDKGTPREYITTSNLYWNRFELDTLKMMCFTDEEVVNSSATKGDLLVCEGGAGYGRSAIWPYDYDICLQNHVHRLRPLYNGASEYVYYIMYLLKESNQIDSVGTAMPGLSAGKLKMIPFPLPPLAEQHRIVSKIEELMPLVEEYGKAQERLETLNRELPEKLKKSVLQEAIMGKLVPQDPKEGTAEELLEEIRKEKEKLVKEGKLKKKDLEIKPIEEDEIPFEIPEGWRWCRYCDVFRVINGDRGKNYPSKDKLSNTGIPFVSALNLSNNSIAIDDRLLCVSEKQFDLLGSGKINKGDTLVCIRGSLGKHGIYPLDRGAIASSLVICRSFYSQNYLSSYLSLYLDSELFKEEIRKYDNGTAQPNLAAKSLEEFLFPLPPLSEQKRIVAKLEEVMEMIEGMK